MDRGRNSLRQHNAAYMFPHRDGSVDHFARSFDHLAGQCLLLFSLPQP
jgi:hypothetical protein